MYGIIYCNYVHVQQRPFRPIPASMLRHRLQYAALLKCFSLHR